MVEMHIAYKLSYWKMKMVCLFNDHYMKCYKDDTSKKLLMIPCLEFGCVLTWIQIYYLRDWLVCHFLAEHILDFYITSCTFNFITCSITQDLRSLISPTGGDGLTLWHQVNTLTSIIHLDITNRIKVGSKAYIIRL